MGKINKKKLKSAPLEVGVYSRSHEEHTHWKCVSCRKSDLLRRKVEKSLSKVRKSLTDALPVR